MPPDVVRVVPGHLAAGALVDDDLLDGAAAAHAERLVDGRLQRHFLAAAVLAVGGDHQTGLGIDDAFLHALRGEAAEHHGVDRADAGASLHGHHRLDRHRQIDEHAVAFLHAQLLQAVGKAADAVIELLVGDLCHLAVVGLEDDGRLVRLRFEMAVEAVVGNIDLAVLEPGVEGGIRFIQHLGELLVPDQVVAGNLAPEPLVVLLALGVKLPVGVHARYVRLGYALGGRRENSGFIQDRFDRGRHLNLSSS